MQCMEYFIFLCYNYFYIKKNMIIERKIRMNQYTYFILGIILGLGIALYLWVDREEKIERRIKLDQKLFSTEKLDKTMETVVEQINKKIKEFKRELTEDEKNEIIEKCYKEKFLI